MRRRQEIDHLSLSFTDVLTCVFGAAIALFLIFVAIVRLVATESASSGVYQGNKKFMARSFQAETNDGFASFSLRIASNNEQVVGAVKPSPSSSLGETVDQFTLTAGDGYNGTLVYGQYLQWNEGLRTQYVFILEEGDARGDVHLQIVNGGVTKYCVISIKPGRDTTEALFTVGPKVEGFLKIASSHTSSAGCNDARNV